MAAGFIFAPYNVTTGLVLRAKQDRTIIGIVSKADANPFGDGRTMLYEVTIIKTGRKLLYNINELANMWEYSDSLQVLYGN